MKATWIRSSILAAALVALASTTSSANTITPGSVLFTPGVSQIYDADLTSGEIHAGDGFTIFDIGGFAGFGLIDPLWSASFSVVGSPFGPSLGPDNAGLMNVHFTYVGPPAAFEVADGAFTYAPFTVLTTSLTRVTDTWVSIDHDLGTAGVIDGGPATVHQDSILVPFGVPDSGSTVALLGIGLIAAATFARKMI